MIVPIRPFTRILPIIAQRRLRLITRNLHCKFLPSRELEKPACGWGSLVAFVEGVHPPFGEWTLKKGRDDCVVVEVVSRNAVKAVHGRMEGGKMRERKSRSKRERDEREEAGHDGKEDIGQR